MGRSRSFGTRLTTGLLAGLLAGGSMFALPNSASATEPVAEQQLVTVVGSGGGVGGSKWLGDVVLTNPSLTETADGRVVLYEQNNWDTPGDDLTNPAISYSIEPRGNVVISDPIAQAGLTGNRAIKIIPDDEIMPTVLARAYNQQDHDDDGIAFTELSQFLPGVAQSEWLQPGDVAAYTGPDSSQVINREGYRWNFFAYGEQANGQQPRVMLELYDDLGQYVDAVYRNIPDHGGTQWTDAVRNLFERDPRPHDTIKATWLSGTGWIDATWVQNNEDIPGFDDGGLQRPHIERLVEEQVFLSAPNYVEVNDPVAIHAYVKSRPNTEVLVGTFGGAAATSVNGNGTNEYSWTYNEPIRAPGTAENTFTYTIADESGAQFVRTAPSHLLTVVPEQNGYVASKADAKAFIMGGNGNLERASYWAALGLAGGWATAPSDWERNDTGWPSYFDGINDPGSENLEMDHMVFLDEGSGYPGGNIFQIYFTNDQVLGVGGIPEAQFDEFRKAVNAQLPD